MDDKLTMKTAKFTSLENLYAYGIYPSTIKVWNSLPQMLLIHAH